MKLFYQNYLETSTHDILLMIGESEETLTDLGTIKFEDLGNGHENSYRLCFWNDTWKYFQEPCVQYLFKAFAESNNNPLLTLYSMRATQIPLTENQMKS